MICNIVCTVGTYYWNTTYWKQKIGSRGCACTYVQRMKSFTGYVHTLEVVEETTHKIASLRAFSSSDIEDRRVLTYRFSSNISSSAGCSLSRRSFALRYFILWIDTLQCSIQAEFCSSLFNPVDRHFVVHFYIHLERFSVSVLLF